MPIFSVDIDYRTASGCNTKKFPNVEANSSNSAYEQCVEKVRKMRGVMKIDGGSVIEIVKTAA